MDRHEVPTHLDVEDRLFWGLTLPRLFGVIAALGAAYGCYVHFPWAVLGLEDSPLRWGIPAVLSGIGIGLFLVRLAGRAVAAWLFDGFLFLAQPHSFSGSPFPGEIAHEPDAHQGDGIQRLEPS